MENSKQGYRDIVSVLNHMAAFKNSTLSGNVAG